MSSIGERIHDRRLALGLSVDELAAKLGKNRATVYRYESSEVENFHISVIGPLAKALDTTPAYLMGWDQEKPAANNGDELTDTDRQLLTLLKQLTPQQKDLLIGLMKQMLQQD